MTTRLIIVRHGEAVCNVAGIAHGMDTCEGLTERGHAQVALLAKRLGTGEIKADVLYASPIARARQTAEPLAEALRLPVQWDDELHEKRPGATAEGFTWRELEERYGPFQHDQPYAERVPGMESWAEFVARAGRALERITQQHEGQTIVVAAHGGIVEASFYLYLNLGPRTPTGFWTHNTSLTEWRKSDRPNFQRWFLLRYNDVAHLADMPPVEQP